MDVYAAADASQSPTGRFFPRTRPRPDPFHRCQHILRRHSADVSAPMRCVLTLSPPPPCRLLSRPAAVSHVMCLHPVLCARPDSAFDG